ncbi:MULTISPECIES: cytochrome c1 [unclassified Thiobacillus]|uniref:cytochrome c1 n=1 Tax=unclassified Thiobacillus TaxID=2646513 RepID=UPI00086AAACB|nr:MULTISPECIES: cytochrome c1 [unclassified Thiobacillus]MBN8778033.1 cytochrome c1 [Thiobacillus sp.]MBS0330963.1 cytochrome c1 [Pseudomonadota bacterium]ODV00409.1 MAG: cytochrome C [Thiobacillus sp. SCN 63-57]TXH72956.1 MAG: cytochrome c1 [Thiobacillus sp.]
MKRLKNFILLLIAVPVIAFASEEGPSLDKAPVNLSDQASLQRGARMFVNYCLNCHSAVSMRYSRMEDLGLTEDQIKENLMFAAEKPGETMTVGMDKKEAKNWFGSAPPDLSVIARARGSDWLYTYLRSFYRDDTRPTGWNNVVFPKVAMPHVLWSLQGEMVPVMKKEGEHEVIERLELAKPGSVTLAEYDAMVGDLVNYLTWMGEPAQLERKQLGLFVLAFLAFFFVVAYYLKKEFWKDVH